MALSPAVDFPFSGNRQPALFEAFFAEPKLLGCS
jgi:hypothetical protein